MADQGYTLRPDAETFEHAGCRLTLVDAAGILAAARARRVELLHGAAFPAPVRRVRFSVTPGLRGARAVHVLTVEIRVADSRPVADDFAAPMLEMASPIAVALARRLAALEPVAARIGDGAGGLAAAAYRRLGLARPTDAEPAPADPTVREDPDAGLRATVTHDETPSLAGGVERVMTVRTEVPSQEITPAHLRAMCRILLDVVAEQVAAGGGTVAGRAYTFGQRKPGASDDERVKLDQVGGLAEVVDQFREIAVSFRHPTVMERWGASRPQGILLYGPPGTGKTMLARALANEIGGTLREIRTPEILDMWMGASERNIKRIFREARRYREPTVMLFDEFDSIISYAGAGRDAASQAVNAVAGIFKQEMNDLIEENPNVVVVATTNFPDRVDRSLTRSGRFDIKVAIPLPDETGRAEILAKMIRQLIARHELPGFRMFADDLDLAELARATDRMTGADLKEVLRRVQLAKAMQEARSGTTAAPIGQADVMWGIADVRRTGTADGPAAGWR
ncbi:MAG TPA: ATP-binding protein [Pilimelia sp.]|nr:ATP-binding protein [Pilimelia sp.]